MDKCQAQADRLGGWFCRKCRLSWDQDEERPPCNPVLDKVAPSPAAQELYKQQKVFDRKLGELRAKRRRNF